MIKPKFLCILAIDTSGSMLEEFQATGISKLAHLNELVPKIISKFKNDPLICDLLELCIIEITDPVTIRVEPTPISNLNAPMLMTNEKSINNIGAGIIESIKKIKKWKNKNIWTGFIGYNYPVYLVLMTDITHELLLIEENRFAFKSIIEKSAIKNVLKFHGIGIGDAKLKDFFNQKVENVQISVNSDFSNLLSDIHNDVLKILKKRSPIFEEINLINKYAKLIKHIPKKLQKLTLALLFLLVLFPLGKKSINSRGIKIKIDKLVEINNVEIKNYENIYPDNDIDIKIEKETHWIGNDDIKFVYKFSYNIENFELGAYMHNSSDEVDLSTQILLRNLYSLEQNFSIAGSVYVKITGETDAVPINNVIYRGELGDIRNEKFFINGQWLKMTIKEYEKLKNNVQLAFLRGYSIWDLIRRNCSFVVSQKTHYQQEAKINDNSTKIGGIYRHVKVEMILYDVESITRAKVEPLLD